MKKLKLFAAPAGALAFMLLLTGCSSLDVVGKASVTSFKEVLNTIPDNVTADEENAGWSLMAPDGSARFIWSADYGQSPTYDVMLEIDAQPFLDAGLDPEKLPDSYAFYESDTLGSSGGQVLMLGKKFGGNEKAGSTSAALSAYELIVSKYRDSINYHTSLDHYGIMLNGGNMFEWAKDMKTSGYDNSIQDKDIVFVLNPEPLIEAGVSPENVEGWAYAQVEVDENGKKEQVWKLLKPFDLK